VLHLLCQNQEVGLKVIVFIGFLEADLQETTKK